MVQICIFCCFHQPLKQAYGKEGERVLWQSPPDVLPAVSVTASFTTTKSGVINFPLSLLSC